MSLTGSAFGGGFATVGETLCEGDLLSNGCALGTSATLQGFLPGDPTDTISFSPTDLVDISKDIDVFGGTGVCLTVRRHRYRVAGNGIGSARCDPVPEPPSLAPLGVGLVGLAGVLVRRKRYSTRAIS